MFSIADIQNEQEAEFEQGEEGEEATEDQPIHSYPIRCSLSVTKVRECAVLSVALLAHSYALDWHHWCHQRRCAVPGGRVPC